VSRRIDSSPAGGNLARLGFYTATVRKVVKEWQGRVPLVFLEDCYTRIALAVIHQTKLELPHVVPQQWLSLIWQLGAAITKVYADKRKPHTWLIQRANGGMTDGRWPEWKEIASEIERRGGPSFTVRVLRQEAKRMKLVTPPGP
jgi:hypothetical protein